MTLLKVVPDTVWMPQEVRQGFAVDADMPKELVPIAGFPTIKAAIELYERVLKWKFIKVVPRLKPPAHLVCCDQIAKGRPGAELTIRFEVSPLQANPDDIGDMAIAVDDSKRLYVDNKIDWVAVLHFVKPALHINQAQIIEEMPRESEGFRSPESMPEQSWAHLIWGGKKE